MSDESPFTLRRFETEHRHLYFLPRGLFELLGSRRSIYLIGSRGTGKTTLLKALHWREQQSNVELKQRLSEIEVKPDYIGIYMKMPDTMASVFAGWPRGASEQFQGAVFALYLDMIWLQGACDAVAQLTLEGVLNISTNAEYTITQHIIQQFPELLNGVRHKDRLTVKGLASLLYEKRRALERWVYSQSARTEDELSAHYPIGQIGAFGRTVANGLVTLCSRACDSDSTYHFKVCLDESECFTPEQQRTLNTLVRLTESPVSFIVSYVRLVDVTRTYIKGITLQQADREVVPLDEMTDQEFTELAEGVATVRLQRVSASHPRFETKSTFGGLSVNELLSGILQSSSSPDSKLFVEAARRFSDTPFYRELIDDPAAALPIYQAYIVDRLNIQAPSPESPKWERRKQDSAEIRKRMVAAYLCLCKELRTQVKYAGAEMVLQISDCCIRDYLSLLDAAFHAVKQSPGEFGSRRIPIDLQDGAIKEASRRKNESIPRSEVGSPIETQRLIEALGKLTNRLQTTIKDEKSLRSPERGQFLLSSDLLPEGPSETVQLITEAAEAGFLKLKVIDERMMQFRLHCSLAAYFGISYRGAYYPCPIKSDDLIPLYRDRDPNVRTERLSQLGDLLLREDPQLPLFGDMK